MQSTISKSSYPTKTPFRSHQMCLITIQTYTQCPCKHTTSVPCDHHLSAIDEVESEHNKYLHLHRRLSQRHHFVGDGEDVGRRKARPDMKNCPLYYKETSDEKIEGNCGMVESGCPYLGTKEKVWKWETPEDLWRLQSWDNIFFFGKMDQVHS
jgi:hypothetical protein